MNIAEFIKLNDNDRLYDIHSKDSWTKAEILKMSENTPLLDLTMYLSLDPSCQCGQPAIKTSSGRIMCVKCILMEKEFSEGLGN